MTRPLCQIKCKTYRHDACKVTAQPSCLAFPLQDTKSHQAARYAVQLCPLGAGLTATQPEVILADPNACLDDIGHQWEIMQPLEHLNRENGVTILMALHDIQYTAWFSRWLVVMQEGRVVVQGVPAEVLTAELMVDVFGMKVRIYPEEEAGHLLCIVLGSRSDATPRS